MGEQNFTVINLDGGLDLVSTHYANQAKPGSCRRLTNFEPSIEGGYRRVNGFSKYGTAQPSGGSNEVYAVYPYADGVVAVSGTGIYFSTDGVTWLQVNRDTYEAQTGTVEVTDGGNGYIVVTGTSTLFTTEFSVGDNIRIDGNIRQITSITSDTSMTLESEISGGVSPSTPIYKNGTATVTASGGTVSPRTSQGHSQIAWLEKDGEYGSLVITDTTGNNDAAWFKITGDGAQRLYYYDTLTSEGFAAPSEPRYCATFEQRVFFGNITDEPNTIFWSDRYQNQRFDGASAGSAQVGSPIIAIRPFKDRMIIFCQNSIYQLVNVNSTATIAILPVSYNTGCAASGSIQELGGDLIFLSHDGIRKLSATDQFGDVTLGVISRKVDPYVKELLSSLSGLTITSTVIRYKNQYRLFYTDSAYDNDQQLGLCGTFKIGLEGELEWQWSRIQGMPISSISSITQPFSDSRGEEIIYHGGYDGYVYLHDSGSSFGGEEITATIELNEIDYGDIGLRKTLHYITLFGDIEGATDDIDLDITYDYGSDSVMQPSGYTVSGLTGIAVYGSAIYDTDTYGGESRFSRRLLVEGSGYSNNFQFNSRGTGSPYSLNSLYVDIRIGAKQ